MIKNLAIIPARGGSKGIIGKNIKPICGKPLIAHTINFIKQTPAFDKIIVSTDDSHIKRVSLEYGAEVIDRPKALATDTALAMDSIRHAVQELESSGETIEYIYILEATSPLRRKSDIVQCMEILRNGDESGEYDSIATLMPSHISPGRMFQINNNTISPYIEGSVAWMPRQSQPKAYQCDGILYGFSNAVLQKEKDSKSAFLGKTYPYITPYECLDIDTLFEFVIIEKLLEMGYPEKPLSSL